jgi:hypothetical protein
MKGYINNILKNKLGFECGYISGEDDNSYYFDSRYLSGTARMEDFNFNDHVEFTPVSPQNGRPYGAAKYVANYSSISTNENNITTTDDQRYGTESSDLEKSSVSSNGTEIIKFYPMGFASHLKRQKQFAFERYLKKGSGEDIIIDKLSEILYISRINHHIIDQSSNYPFCLLGATEIIKQYIRGQYEFLLIFSHFDSGDWQQKTLIVEREIRKRREIADRRPLVNFYILICNATNLKQEIDKVKGGTTSAVIPFSYDEVLQCDSIQALTDLILGRFNEYFFENDMLGETSAIDDDNLLFGDRCKIADSIVARCHQMNNSGIFGLRRSGKSSVLKAVLRRLERDNVKYIEVESRSLESLDSWKTALYDIACLVRSKTLGIEKNDGETRREFTQRLNLNSTEEDYKKRSVACFVEDVKIYSRDFSPFVIAIDEIELITYNTAQVTTWKSIEAFSGFWGALRDCGCPLILCGVNSTINESGQQGDNPMYGRIISCAESSETYLPSFTDEQTKVMITALGGYSQLSFSEVYSDINRAFGGQPYAIRQFCSYVFGKVKDLREPNKVYSVSKATVDNLLKDFNNSQKGKDFCSTILQRLSDMYTDEYRMLKRLALASEKYKTIEHADISKIDHLEKYGLIEYDRSTFYVTFKINIVKEYICKVDTKDPSDMPNDERRRYVQDRVADCEIKLKTYIKNFYSLTGKTAAGRAMFLRYITNTNVKIDINKKANPQPDPNICAFRDFFDHKLFIIYFSSLKKIINDNWSMLGKSFQSAGISQDNFRTSMDDLNAGRTDADHYDAEDTTICPDDWQINDIVMQSFRVAYDKLKRFFDDNNL